MSSPIDLLHLKVFVEMCTANPALLHSPDLAFVKSFIEHFGGKVPGAKSSNVPKNETQDESKPKEPEQEPEQEPKPVPDPESDESDLDLDTTDVIEPDTDAPQKMGNPTLQPTDEEIAESQAKRSEAVSAFVEKDYEKAIQLYTEAIVLNPQASLLYAKRGQVYLLLKKPNACIRDCNRALELNPDSAAAHKFRGRAYHLLGKWEEAANDLRLACKFDFDEQADEWLREATPNARKIEEHKRKKERKLQEKLERERQERLKQARDSAKKYEDNTRPSQTDTSEGADMGDFNKFLNDLEVMQGFEDPEVAEAFKEMSVNPTNILKYQNNPKVMSFINKMATKFGGPGGMPSRFPGMMGGMPGFPDPGVGASAGAGAGADAGAPTGQPAAPPPKPPQDDVGLD